MMIQQTKEWLEMRKNHIGASDAPVIMGISPWKTPFQLWEEKLGLRNQNTNAAMKRGLELEETARLEFEKQTGIIVFPYVAFHQEYKWMMASLDGIDIEKKHIVEIKCPGAIDHEKAMDGIIPEKYYPQLQHQMLVTGLSVAFYFSYSEKSSKLLEIGKDALYQNNLIKSEKDFWRCVSDLEPPAYSDKDFTKKEDEEWTNLTDQWKNVSKKLEQLQEEEKFLREQLINMSGNSACIGAGIKLFPFIRKGTIDYKAIPELKYVDLEKYRKPNIQGWRLTTS